ncbi:EVE domain-containing protein [Microbacterium sp. NPDC077663]|uniref:EVE domain-containing protein n=1 Tax=Microbacterium sp. NPDC077663 TaxID=3364189 RepID=UPI0037C730AD
MHDISNVALALPERAWLGVVSAEHAAYGAERGWIQLNHGKRNNLARLRRGDGFVFYSPTQRLGDKTPLRAVTQLGIVADEEPHLADELMEMGAHGAFRPWRRDVDFAATHPVAVHDLPLELTRDRGWGYSLRFGLVPLAPSDFALLRDAMTS